MKPVRHLTSAIRLSMAFFLVSIFFMLPGCGGKSGNNLSNLLLLGASGDKNGMAHINASDGGVIKLNDEVTLTIPPDSLPDDATISIRRETRIPQGETDGLSAFGQAYRFLPKGTGFDLASPAVLEMHYDETTMAQKGLSPRTTQICYFDEELQCFVPVNCFVDMEKKTITAYIEHFTVYLPMAQALLATNNAPTVALQAPVPNPIRADAPIYVRATVADYDGSVAGVTLQYRKLRPAAGAWQEARMVREVNPRATLHTYGYLVPASFLTAADLGTGNDIECRVIATDNLGASRTSATRRYNVTRTYQSGSLSFNPSAADIASGFERYFVLRGVDSSGTTFNLVPETYDLADASSTITNRFTQGILYHANAVTPAGSPDYLTAGFAAESASASINVHAGEIETLEVLDTNGLSISGDLAITEGNTYAFDVVGRDAYGNTIPVIPEWTADAGIGIISPDGALDTTGGHGPGVVTASLLYTSDTQNVVVQSHEKEFTAFSINGVDGVIAYPFITVTLPWGTDVTGLVVNFTTTGVSVTADSEIQQSGVTTNDFTDPVVYTVTAEDGSSQDYTVRVMMLKPFKDIILFYINDYYGTIDGANITVTMPQGTDVTSLAAHFVSTGDSVAVNGVVQQRGITVNNFTNPVVYRVTAEDGTNQGYTVTVNFGNRYVSHFVGAFGGPGAIDGIGQHVRFSQVSAVTSDGTNLFVVDKGNNTIRKIVIATGEVTTLAGQAHKSGITDGNGSSARFSSLETITTDGANLYLTDSGRIRKVVIATRDVTTVATVNAVGITCVGSYLYTAAGNMVRRIDTNTGEITPFAGLEGSYGLVDGIGSEARFSNLWAITSDGTNLYVTDNHAIRRIVIANAEVATLAGSGTSGSADGIGAEATFRYPRGISCDGISCFISDTYNNTIRKLIISTGEVMTVAGFAGSYGYVDGSGSTTRFQYPLGSSIVGSALYIADANNLVIRKITIQSGDVSTFAGVFGGYGYADGIGSLARFYAPESIASDGTNFYIADSANHAIRKVVIATGEVTTLAGLGGTSGTADGFGSDARFNYPRGITCDGANVYVADYNNYTIRKIVIATGEVTTLAGLAGTKGTSNGTGSAARFNNPTRITTDGTYLYLTDNYAIRRVDPSAGEVLTIAGQTGAYGYADGTGTSARFRGLVGITTDGTNIYVVDSGSNTIRMMGIESREVTTLAGSAGSQGLTDGIGSEARFLYPTGICTDGTYLYLVDEYGPLRQIEIATGEVTTIAGRQITGYGESIDGFDTEVFFSIPYDVILHGSLFYVLERNGACVRIVE